MKPKLTITASNRDRFQIRDCERSATFIKSIQWQTYTDFELLIADGGSKNFEEIKSYFENEDFGIPIRIVQCKIGEAFERARLNNVGVRNAKSDYIMTTDVDMLFGKDFVKTLMENVGENILVESRTMYLKPTPANMIYNGTIDAYNNIDDCKRGRIKKRTTAGGCQCMHISGWNKIRGFDESYVGWGSEDYDLLTRAKRAGIKPRWMGESRESIMLFHLPHSRNTKRDLEYQEENKKRLHKIESYKVNPNGWGDRKD